MIRANLTPMFRNKKKSNGTVGKFMAKKAPGIKPKKTVSAVALKVSSIADGISAGEEKKFVDFQLASGFNGTLTVNTVNVLALGTDLYQRVARKVQWTSLQIRAQILPTFGNGNNQLEMAGRCLIIWDRQPTGTAPAAADILRGTSATAVNFTDTLSPLNPDNRDRFIVLRDWNPKLPALGIAGAAAADKNVVATNSDSNVNNGPHLYNIFIDLRGLSTIYNNTGAANLASIASGALYVITYASPVTVGGAAWQLQGSARLRFADS